MALSSKAVERLTMLANYMDGLHPRWPDKFDMGIWSKGRIVCGTRACAIGWGVQMPEFRAMGLRLREEWNGIQPCFNGKTNWAALAEFFDMTERQTEIVFGPDLKDDIETPQAWAAHCRLFISQNTPTSTPDFEKFMAKAKEPVKL
jgi:hypothetical protein